ncbi:DUF2000 domain-containing protein [Amycolatopsis lurida]
MPEETANKCAIVVSEELPAGLAANAAGVLSITLGHRISGLVGADVKDADGVVHPGIVRLPIPILNVPFSALAQSCKTYDEYIGKMAATATADLDIVGVGLHGPRKPVNRLVGSLPLLR